ncbi:hypothetical protein [Streptomyces kaniharaensis]|uniref:hypothetical protein n=1 Tax=Streptomyces kaniharaensis TaxID=212423 RepID=UPI0018A82AD5|nr:hypothetical protein [Streptomyces kaniharaensis]
MRRSRKARRLVVGDETYLWTVRHAHDVEDGYHYRDCREILTLRRHGAHGRLLLVFLGGEGRLVPDGYGPSGVVGTGGHWLNLNEPGTARALLDEAVARGWDAAGPAAVEVDGWAYFTPVAARREPRDGCVPPSAPDESTERFGEASVGAVVLP